MKIVFFADHAGLIRYYRRAIKQLVENGHSISFYFDRQRGLGEEAEINSLKRELSQIECYFVPGYANRRWASFATKLRTLQDYLRYTHPHYVDAVTLRQRVEDRVEPTVVKFVTRLERLGQWAPRSLQCLLRWIEWAIPIPEEISSVLEKEMPDLVVVSPLVYWASRQVDPIKAAKSSGVPTVFCVLSWDNLTNKGLMRVIPERTLVWNEAQKCEAVDFHHAPASRVRVTGAQVFDKWFDRQPSLTREEFCAGVGIDPSRPFILYVGSSRFIAPTESRFVERWVRLLHSSDNLSVRSASILLRPHPKNTVGWSRVEEAGIERVRLWPVDSSPFDTDYDSAYFDSLYHSVAVVGVNTSAMVEAAIVGRPVLTWKARDFQHSQDGTLHFDLLLSVGGGLLHVGKDAKDHLSQLAEAIDSSGISDSRSVAFTDAFIRPAGRDIPATNIFVEALEGAATTSLHDPVARRARFLLRPIGSLLAWYFYRPKEKKGNTSSLGRRRLWIYPLKGVFRLLMLVWTTQLWVMRAIASVIRGGRQVSKWVRLQMHRAGKRWRKTQRSVRLKIHKGRKEWRKIPPKLMRAARKARWHVRREIGRRVRDPLGKLRKYTRRMFSRARRRAPKVMRQAVRLGILRPWGNTRRTVKKTGKKALRNLSKIRQTFSR